MSWEQRHPEKKRLSGDVLSKVMSRWPTSSDRPHFCVAGAAVNSPVDWTDESSWYLISQSPHVLGTRCSKHLFGRYFISKSKQEVLWASLQMRESSQSCKKFSKIPCTQTLAWLTSKMWSPSYVKWSCGDGSEYNEHITIMHQSWFECAFVVESLKQILTYVPFLISDLWESHSQKMTGFKFAFDVKIFVAL